MEFFSLVEILTAVTIVLGGQKGFEVYKKKRFSNGGRDRRSSSGNSLAQSDKDFIGSCFKDQTKDMENDRLKLVITLSDIVREESGKTRSAMRSIIQELK